jgi:hypothetical protein
MSAISGRVAFWKAVGVGLLGLGAGAAVGIGFYGYSFVTRNGSQLDILTSALEKSLAQVELHGTAEGKVEVASPGLVLEKGATISIDPTSRLVLDPSAKVVADGEVRIQMPNISMPRGPTPKNAAQSKTIANFTVFKSVPFDQGNVLTGWIFLTSAQESPTQQYCYYNERDENSDTAIRIDLAVDGSPEANKAAPRAFDTVAALSRCVWFKRSAP